jgi:hypothetical protein
LLRGWRLLHTMGLHTASDSLLAWLNRSDEGVCLLVE